MGGPRFIISKSRGWFFAPLAFINSQSRLQLSIKDMKTNFLLVSVAGVPKIMSDFIPDIGMASLASNLLANGHGVKILDLNLPSLCGDIFTPEIERSIENFARKVFLDKKKPGLKDILMLRSASRRLERRKLEYSATLRNFLEGFVYREKIDAVGFKLWAGEGFTWSIEAGRHLKKKYPGLKVFGGGPQVDIFGQDIYRVGDFFDALCYCEGEESITMLANFVQGSEKLENIPNIIFRRGNSELARNPRKHVEDLDSLPLPVYSPDIYLNIGEKLKVIVLEESRGCPNSCHFCIHPVKSGKRRTKSAGKVIREMKEYGSRYGVRVFKYAGSSTPGSLMSEIAGRIIEDKMDVSYSGFGHVNDYDVDFGLLKRSGCESIFFGVESASEDILKRGMNKNLKKTDMEKVLIKCRASGIFTVASFIYPAPFETPETRMETVEFIKKVAPDSVLIQFPGIYPGTEWFRHPEKYNFRLLGDREDYPFRVMTYQIRNLFPPRYWDPLPYTVNGMPFRKFAAETEMLQREIRQAGLETSVSDESYLLYRNSSYVSLGDFLDRNRYLFYSGKSRELCQEVKNINGKAALHEA